MDELPQADVQTSPSPKPEHGGRMLPLIGLVVALAVGGGAGFVGMSRVVVPAAGSEKKAVAKKPEEATSLYLIENLVVNPQGTKGARFLIVSVALQPVKADGAEELKRLDPELRDAYGHALAAKTVDELSDIGRRDSVKAELRRVTERVAGPQTVREVFLPQFVLQ